MRLNEINHELKELNQKRRELLDERRKLLADRSEREAIETSQFWADPIFAIIKSHPGISRSKILSELDKGNINPRISNQVLTNTLTTLRRRGLIKNQGTKKNPQWYVGNGSRDSSRIFHCL